MKYIVKFAKNKFEENKANHLCVGYEIEKKDRKETEKTKNTFLIAVIDRSGSMSSSSGIQSNYNKKLHFDNLSYQSYESTKSKLTCAKEATKNVLNLLKKDDKFAVVAFDSSVSLIQSPISIPSKETNSYDKIISKIKSNISNIETKGITNISDALKLAMSLIDDEDKEIYNCKVILLSDGEANVGYQNAEEFIPLMSDFVKHNISVSSIGLGLDYNLALMETISGNSGGMFYHIQDANVIEDLFIKELKLTRDIVVKNAKIMIKVPKDCEIGNNLNRYNQINSDGYIEIELGNIFTDKQIYLEVNNNSKETKSFDFEVEFYEEESLVNVVAISIDVAGKNEKIIEDNDLIKHILELVKDNYVLNASTAYSSSNSKAVQQAYNACSATINNISSSYCCCDTAMTTSQLNELNDKYTTGALQEDDNRKLFATSSCSVRNGSIK